MNKTKNGKLTGISKALRKNMTKTERKLWYDFLKQLPITVNRQKVMGNYVVDFYCAQEKLIIEVDGIQHETEEGMAKDAERDAYFESLGLKLLRVSSKSVLTDFDNVCYRILCEMPNIKCDIS